MQWPVGFTPVIIFILPTLPDKQSKAQKQLVQSYPVSGAKVRSSERKGSIQFNSPAFYRDLTA